MKKPGFVFKNSKIPLIQASNPRKKNNFKKWFKKGKIWLKKFKFFKFLPGLALIWVIIFIGNKLVINTPSNIITQIQFEKQAISYYDNPDLFSKISDFLSGKNIILASNQVNSLLISLKQQYPLVQNITLKKTAPHTALVHIVYSPPSFVALLSWEARGSINQIFFPIPLTSTLLKDSKTPAFYLPDYYQGSFPLSGFFFKIKEDQLSAHLKIIKKYLNPKQIIYIPGGSKYEIHWKDKILYLDGTKSIQNQIENFLLLLKNQSKLKASLRQRTKADLWSLSGAIILTP